MVDRKLSVHFTDPTHTYPHTSFSLEDSIRKAHSECETENPFGELFTTSVQQELVSS